MIMQMALDVSALLPIVDTLAKRDKQLAKLKHSVGAILTALMPKTDRKFVDSNYCSVISIHSFCAVNRCVFLRFFL